MASINVEKLEICFCGYNLDKLDKRDGFKLQKALEQSVENYLFNSDIHVKETVIGFDLDRRPGIAVRFFSPSSKEQLLGRFSEEGLRDTIAGELGGVFQEYFGDLARKKIVCEFHSERETMENRKDGEESIEDLASRYRAIDPFYTFDNLIIGRKTLDEIEIALAVLEYSDLVFEKWGLKKIEPFPRAVLNFYGPPGTGKTLAAHAIASKLGKKVLLVGCPEIQSKYHGESSKNVKAVFHAAEKSDAVLFFDESDSLLSKRLEEVNSGAEDEINNMRNTMLMCLEMHKGIVIFASNFVKRYDYAFETRVQSVLFPIPDLDTLEKIWSLHLLPTIETRGSIDIRALAKQTVGFCGRDVKNAVVKACFTAIHGGRMYVTQQDILDSCERIRTTREDLKHADYSQSNISSPEAKPEQRKLADVIAAKEENWRKSYFAAIPCEDALDIRSIIKAAQGLRDSEIRQAVENACYSAYEMGAEQISDQDVLDAIEQIRLAVQRKEESGGMEELKEALRNLILERKFEEQANG